LGVFGVLGVFGGGVHTETLEPLIIYSPLYECKIKLFARPQSMFTETITRNGKKIKRFKYICDK